MTDLAMDWLHVISGDNTIFLESFIFKWFAF